MGSVEHLKAINTLLAQAFLKHLPNKWDKDFLGKKMTELTLIKGIQKMSQRNPEWHKSQNISDTKKVYLRCTGASWKMAFSGTI